MSRLVLAATGVRQIEPANNPAAFLLVAGQDVTCHIWGRDLVATGSLLSAGIQYTVEP